MATAPRSDAIIVGAGLSGLVAAAELVDAGRRVTIVDQEPEATFGGQAWWSFGGLFLVNSPEQRRMGIRDSADLARSDWATTAGFDRDEDAHARLWADAYVDWAAGEKRAWLRQKGIGLFPVVGWAERGGDTATGHGNSVPRFHIVWGTGPAILEPFIRTVRRGVDEGLVTLLFRHRVDALSVTDGRVDGVTGSILAPDDAERGGPSNRETIGDFALAADAVVVASGGIGGNHELVRAAWPERLGTPPTRMLSGVPAHVDGRGLAIAESGGARLVNGDRMWHYVEGLENYAPVWARHGIRILPGPSSLWLDATGRRLPTPLFPGFDTLGTLAHLRQTGYDHSWFVTTQSIIEKEFALSGSEQNPDLTGRSVRELIRQRLSRGATEPVERFVREGADFVTATSVDELVAGMAALEPDAPLDVARVRDEIAARDRMLDNEFGKDAQLTAIRGARRYRGDKLIRVAAPHRLTDPKHGPMIAVRLHVLTRKSLGGIQTDLDGRAIGPSGEVVPGLYAVGESAGFGGGGVHGYRSLEGTFLGGCLHTGLRAGRAIAGR
ncbi:hypothetical protein EV141_0440 [Microcella putealis]|uniref:FAD-dependent oxidoreductase 2 FAD-binding domain-containing protein n=1 Tax=Microcella putealis TaxID=337005 RepID=A0A4Q7LXQ4_9MICO|nr:FAD-binding dehydrogenase [Microcella putealis]RZS59222.1 hypothetical protein EV141_0440 [Microcella putealis]TQM24248.1 hypothetical protein BJ957_1719 [Microcella putealis]